MSSDDRDQKPRSSDEGTKGKRSFKRIGAYFKIGPTLSGRSHGLYLENEDKIVAPPNILLAPPPGQKYGFPEFPEKPRFRPDKTFKTRPPNDLEGVNFYWLISQRVKDVIASVDPSGAVFADCDVFYVSGKLLEERYYLCDVIREIDALDEQKSNLVRVVEDGYEYYPLLPDSEICFKSDIVGDAHIFRQEKIAAIFCDALMKDALISAGLKDPSHFRDVSLREYR
jgi:hypothetical protein